MFFTRIVSPKKKFEELEMLLLLLLFIVLCCMFLGIIWNTIDYDSQTISAMLFTGTMCFCFGVIGNSAGFIKVVQFHSVHSLLIDQVLLIRMYW